MKRRIFFLISILMSAFFLVACSRETPKDVVQNYFNEIAKGENAKVKNLVYDNVEEHINSAFRNEKINANEEDSKEVNKALDEALSKISATVGEEKIDGNKATVQVTVKGVNLSNAVLNYISELIKSTMNAALNGKVDEDKLQIEYSEKLVSAMKNANTEERSGTVTLTNVDGNWKIDVDSDLTALIFGKVSVKK